jgi:hypothetical protein
MGLDAHCFSSGNDSANLGGGGIGFHNDDHWWFLLGYDA